MKRKLTKEEIIDRIGSAIKNGEIYVCYQAQINHATGRMIGAEALVRWDDAEYGPQSPADFIPVLEDDHQILKLDLFVFEEVCKLQRYCLDNNMSPVSISINMSRGDISSNGNAYLDEIEKIRAKYNIPVKYLHIEITESFADCGVDLLKSVLKRMHEIGYIVEMDDFGCGYSSLGALKDLDVDVIKLDMGFFNSAINERGNTIISSIAQMAKWLNTLMIAEGVETTEQADYMQSLGCYYIQGYLYAKPVKTNTFINLIENGKE